MLDLLIRGGDVIDGTGVQRRRADVGVQDGRIVSIGSLDVAARSELDATGKVVAPGFVDVHTHFDAQVFWDPDLTPSSLHGVTSVMAGHCGFTLAPLSGASADTDYLIRMLARVEAIPSEAVRLGLPWSWRGTGEYLDAIEGRLSINAAFMTGHSAIRRTVMGEQATQRPARPDELRAMQDVLRESLAAGAIGFSSSWARSHVDGEGNMVPSRHAEPSELVELSRVVGEYEGTSLEFGPCLSSLPFEPWALELMTGMSAAASRPLNWNLLAPKAANGDFVTGKLAAGDYARRRGGRIVALTMPMNMTVRLTFFTGFLFDGIPGWEEVMFAPLSDRIEAFRDPATRSRLGELSAAPHPLSGLTDWDDTIVLETFAPENEQYAGLRLGDIGAQSGRTSWDALCDIVVADELRTSFGKPATPDTAEDWAARLPVWRSEDVVLGGSDAGAHLDLITTYNYPTELLAKAVRTAGVVSLEEAIYLLTKRPAELYGLRGRGTIAAGNAADLVVLDEREVASEQPQTRFDLPGGAMRRYAAARGIEHVVCNGVQVLRHGAPTGARPGQVLRSGRDTYTPAM